jgi:hypothetical protein
VSGSECHLSEKTARDVGGLDTGAGSEHHFEMKPFLGGFMKNLVVDLMSIDPSLAC